MDSRTDLTTTRPLPQLGGSAVDPLVAEVSWAAWRLVGAQPREGAIDVIAHRIRLLAQALWLPGRVVLMTQASGCKSQLTVDLAVGMLTERGQSSGELQGAITVVDSTLRVRDDLPLGLRRIAPESVLGAVPETSEHCVLVRQPALTFDLPEVGFPVEAVSRFNPMPNPWAAVLHLLAVSPAPITVRATALPTTLGVDDELRLHEAAERLTSALPGPDSSGRPTDAGFAPTQVWRAQRTVIDLRESYRSPVFVSEIAIWSSAPLSQPVLRQVAGCFTSAHAVPVDPRRRPPAGGELVRCTPGEPSPSPRPPAGDS